VPSNGVHPSALSAETIVESGQIERQLAATLIQSPHYLDIGGLEDLAVADFVDPAAAAVMTAVRNLQDKGQPVDRRSVTLELERTAGVGSSAADLSWVPRMVLSEMESEKHRTGRVLAWTALVRKWARERAAEMLVVDAQDRSDDELNEFAMRDAEPTTTGSDDWNYGPPLSDWLGEKEPDEDDSADWHIRGLVARDVAAFNGGDMKLGKTMIIESQSIALAMGAPDWCGFPIYGGPKRVLLMPREDSERTTKIRLWQLARGAGLESPLDIKDHLSVDPTSPLNLTNPQHIQRLRRACERYDVVFIDSFATTHPGDENSVKDIARALEPARDIASSTKTALVFVHHYNGKGNPEDPRAAKHRLRGSSAIAGYARHIVGVSRGPEKGLIKIETDGNLEYQVEPFVVRLVNGTTENRFGEMKKTLRYELVGLAKDAASQKVRDDVVAAVLLVEDGHKSANAIATAVGGNRKLALAAVKHELDGGRLEYRDGMIKVKETR
jgi:hypothetical protein